MASLPQQGSHWIRRPWVSRALGACPTWRVGAICGDPQGTGPAGVSVLWGEVTVRCPWLGGAWGGVGARMFHWHVFPQIVITFLPGAG